MMAYLFIFLLYLWPVTGVVLFVTLANLMNRWTSKPIWTQFDTYLMLLLSVIAGPGILFPLYFELKENPVGTPSRR